MTLTKYADKLRVAVVGAGFGKAVHVPAFRADPRCQVVAIAASSDAKALSAASDLGIPRATGDWRQIVADPAIDAVSIAVPPLLQAEIAAGALGAGKHVFLEKPVGISADQSERLVTLARQQKCVTAVDFEFPEIDAWLETKRNLDGGTLGPLRHAAVTWRIETFANRKGLTSWKTSTASGGGTLGSFVSHTFYYLEWLFGPIAGLWAHLSRPADDNRPTDTVNTIAVETVSGMAISICVAADAFLGQGHRLDVFGRDGTLVLENPTADYVSGFQLALGDRTGGALVPVRLPSDASARPGADGRVTAVSRLVKRFVDAALGQGACSPNIEHGHRVQRLLDLARESDRLGRRLAVPTD